MGITSEPIEQEKEEEEEVMIRPSSVTMSDMGEESKDQRGKDENTNNIREESKITSLAKTRPSFTKKRPSSSIGRSFKQKVPQFSQNRRTFDFTKKKFGK